MVLMKVKEREGTPQRCDVQSQCIHYLLQVMFNLLECVHLIDILYISMLCILNIHVYLHVYSPLYFI